MTLVLLLVFHLIFVFESTLFLLDLLGNWLNNNFRLRFLLELLDYFFVMTRSADDSQAPRQVGQLSTSIDCTNGQNDGRYCERDLHWIDRIVECVAIICWVSDL